MERILNVRTNTVHASRDRDDSERTACGSLVHVPDAHTRRVTDEDLRAIDSTSRCGNCFEDTGGGY
jgi:hypothetical protein